MSSSSTRNRSSALRARRRRSPATSCSCGCATPPASSWRRTSFSKRAASTGCCRRSIVGCCCAAVEALRPHAQAIASAPLFFAVNVSEQSLQSRRYAAFALGDAGCRRLAAEPVLLRAQGARGARSSRGRRCVDPRADRRRRQSRARRFRLGLELARALEAAPRQLPEDRRRRSSGASATDRIAESIVSGIARAARTLGVATIAEHVETAAVAERLHELEVTLGQGFHFGRPQPFAETVRQLGRAPRRGGSRDPRLSSRHLRHIRGLAPRPYNPRRFCQVRGRRCSDMPLPVLRARRLRPALPAPKPSTSRTACGSGCTRRPIRATGRSRTSSAAWPSRCSSAIRTTRACAWPTAARVGSRRRILVAEKPAAARVLELEAEIGGFESAAAAAKTAQAAAEHELARLRSELQATTGSAESIEETIERLRAREQRARGAARGVPLRVAAAVGASGGRRRASGWFSRGPVVARRVDTAPARRLSRVLAGAGAARRAAPRAGTRTAAARRSRSRISSASSSARRRARR